MIVDSMFDSHPEMKEDMHWNENFHSQMLMPSPTRNFEVFFPTEAL